MIPIDTVGHNVVEVFIGNESIIIEIGFGEHVLEFLITQILAEILGDLLEFVDCELALG